MTKNFRKAISNADGIYRTEAKAPVLHLKHKGTIMKVSARNLIPGTVKSVTLGQVNAEVVIEAGGVAIVSVITKESAAALGLKAGSKAYAMVKATNVMVVTD